jgi:leucyl aminopeptidase
VFSDSSAGSLVKVLDKKLSNSIKKVKQLGDFDPRPGSSCLLYTDGTIKASRLLLIGLGKRKEFKPQTLRRAVSAAISKAVDLKAKSVLLSLHTDIPASAEMDSVAEGACFGAFRYDEYITDPKRKTSARIKVVIPEICSNTVTQLRKGVSSGVITGRAQNYARMIANRPGSGRQAAQGEKDGRDFSGWSGFGDAVAINRIRI